jgi:hypothetical protein
VALFWGPRPEAIEICALRAYDSLRALQALGYEHYFFRGASREEALKREFNVTTETVLRQLAKGMNYTDPPVPRPMPELGWHMGFWSGGPDAECYVIDFNCGSYSTGNSVVLKLPPSGPFSIAVAPERALKAYEALVGVWSPDQAVVCEGDTHWDEERRLVTAGPPLAQYPARAT